MLLATVSYVDRQTVSILALDITKTLHISEAEWGWVVAVFSLAYLVGTPLGGWWIERVGARRGLVIALVVWSAIAALHAIVPSFAALIALRIALGVAEGPGYPAAAQSMHRIFAPPDRARGFGMLFIGASLGTMVAAPLATLLYRAIGWRGAFFGTTLVGLTWLVPWILLTRRPAVRAQLEERALDTPRAPPGSMRRLIVHPVLLRAVVAIFVSAPIMGFVFGWGAKYLGGTFGVEQGDVGFYLWLPPLAFDAGAFVFGDLAARRRRVSETPPRALVCAALALGLAIALVPFAATPWQGTLLLSLPMAGAGALYTLISADMFARIPGDLVALSAGLLAVPQSLALMIAGPVIGWSIGRRHDYVEVTIGLGALLVPGVVAWLLWPPTRFAAGSSSTP